MGIADYARAMAVASPWLEVTVDGRRKVARSRRSRTCWRDADVHGARARDSGNLPGGRRDRRPGRRLKVVLYNPKAVFFTMPLALLAIGSELDPEKYEVVIVDGRLDAGPRGRPPRLTSMTRCVWASRCSPARRYPMRSWFRARRSSFDPTCPSSGADGIPRCSARECLVEPAVDVSVQAQGEETFAEIVDRLAKAAGLEGCAGCTVRRADGRICTQSAARPLRPLDRFRAHDYWLIPVERYFELKGKRQLDFISSQGCNFRCAFCSDPVRLRPQVGGPRPRVDGRHARSRNCGERYRFDDVNFQDETFFTRRDRVRGHGATGSSSPA